MISESKVEEIKEPDLAPMLSMMVTLIPILLLATAFVQIKIIETPLPQLVEQAIARDRENDQRKAEISVGVDIGNGFVITVKNDQGPEKVLRVPNVEGQFNYDGLHEKLYRVKLEQTDIFRIVLVPHAEVPYSVLVKTMDAARRVRPNEAKFVIRDEQKKEQAETDLMFPDVVFGNIIEG